MSFLRIEPALDLVAQLFFLKLFRLDPSLRKKFSGPVEIQAKKFAAGAKLAMISLGHEDGLAPTLKLLARATARWASARAITAPCLARWCGRWSARSTRRSTATPRMRGTRSLPISPR
nr:hypothetical protein [Methyloceanibacter marginalis]